MPTLYVTEPGATVRVSGESILVTVQEDPDGKEGPEPERRRIIVEVEPHRLELIALMGRAHITCDAVRLCLEKGICVAWFSRNGRYRGRLVPEMSKSADLRLLQYAAVQDKEGRLVRARAVVASKLANAMEVLKDVQSNDSGNTSLSSAIAALKAGAGKAATADGPESLLGIEGTGARDYFTAFGTAFRKEIGFKERARRPSPDPANAMLSFGYVLLGNVIGGALEARGLDPALGFYHEVRSGRQSLALDLLEELRHPIVDRFVLRACNLRIMKPDLFEADEERQGGIRLTKAGLKVFFGEWEKHLLRPIAEADSKNGMDVLSLVRRQVERLAADMRGTGAYQPFRYRG